MKEKDEKLAVLRKAIFGIMKRMRKEWTTADEIFAKVPTDDEVTLEKVGNNLRVLKAMGVADSSKIKGRRHWKLTGKSFDPAPPVKMVVAFPKDVHDSMTEASDKRDMSKTDFIIESVENNLT